MSSSLVLPRSTAELVGRTGLAERHPGLQLDKFSIPGSQEKQRKAIEAVCETKGDADVLRVLLERRERILRSLGAVRWQCETSGPLTLHLARASALENAGICLHPLYGFTYLPGSGLKGMARAFAETVWMPTRYKAGEGVDPRDDIETQKAAEAWRQIEKVFGWAPHSDDRKPWKPSVIPARGGSDAARVGDVVFHDAWPEAWPRLIPDIINNHHSGYYRGENAPGDWENPNLVSFLAVGPGLPFSFALSAWKGEDRDGLLGLAREWLIGALCHMGAGAKTAAGYGSFRPLEGEAPALVSPAREVFETALELVTPAFLAGAGQGEEDCELRPATLRGLLRWWWRTMHAGHVDVDRLRGLEAAVWGDTNAGGAVRIAVEPAEPIQPVAYAHKDKFKFKRQHDLQDRPNQKTTQGLFYASYGMDDAGRQRWYLLPGTKWTVRLIVRASQYPADNKPERTKRIGPKIVLDQARAALWLFCRFGGAGSKSRKGFGSFADIGMSSMSLDACKNAALRFRDACGIVEKQPHDVQSSCLEEMFSLEFPTPWKDWWFALDQVGFSTQAYAQGYAHKEEKMALGLPRNIHGPRPHISRALTSEKGKRHASPVHYHLNKDPEGNLAIRVTAFPARYLPDKKTSRKFLRDLLSHLKADLEGRTQRYASLGKKNPQAKLPLGAPAPQGRPRLPGSNESVEAVLLEEKTKRGGWRAKHGPSDLSGPIQNSDAVPPEAKAGDSMKLVVAFANPNAIAFRWPTPADETRSRKQGPRGDGMRR